MLQVKSGPRGPLKIKSIRKTSDAEHGLAKGVCSVEAGNGLDKPPC